MSLIYKHRSRKHHLAPALIVASLTDFTLLVCYTVLVKTKKRKKRLIVQIDVIELMDGHYYIDTTQLSNLIIPLTEFEKNSPSVKNPVAKNELKQAIEDAKKYIQQLAHILHYDVSIKVKKS